MNRSGKKIKKRTHKSLKKRVKITGSDKWICKSAHTSHLSASKTKRQKKRLDQSSTVKNAEFKKLKNLI